MDQLLYNWRFLFIYFDLINHFWHLNHMTKCPRFLNWKIFKNHQIFQVKNFLCHYLPFLSPYWNLFVSEKTPMYSTRAFCKKRPWIWSLLSQRRNVIMLWCNIMMSWRQTPVVLTTHLISLVLGLLSLLGLIWLDGTHLLTYASCQKIVSFRSI